jgi:hypothetical protein
MRTLQCRSCLGMRPNIIGLSAKMKQKGWKIRSGPQESQRRALGGMSFEIRLVKAQSGRCLKIPRGMSLKRIL